MKEWRSGKGKWEEFRLENRSFFNNPVVKSFLNNQKNVQALIMAVENPTKESREIVDMAFKKHFFTIRFTAYISSIMEFSTQNFNKNLYQYENRFPLILADTEEGKNKYFPYLVDHQADMEIIRERETVESSIEDYITDPDLYEGILTLTESQRKILTFSYLYQLKDTEIAQIMGKSQQYISKTRKTVLNRLNTYMAQKGVEGIGGKRNEYDGSISMDDTYK